MAKLQGGDYEVVMASTKIVCDLNIEWECVREVR